MQFWHSSVPCHESGKTLLPVHVGVIVIEVVCSQSTFVGVNDIETDTESVAVLKVKAV